MTTEQKLTAGDIARLLKVVTSLSQERGYSPSEAIDLIAELVRPERKHRRSRRVLADFVERLRRLRMRRNALMGASLFRDPAWDMLLALYSAHERGREVSVSSICYASGVPLSTALRQLSRLQEHGLIVRQVDSSDGRREFVTPTRKAVDAMSHVVATLMEDTRAADGTAAAGEPDAYAESEAA